MRISFYSLRAGILAYLVFLIVCAMLLINVVMVKLTERDLIQKKADSGRLMLNALGKWVEKRNVNRENKREDFLIGPQLESEIKQVTAIIPMNCFFLFMDIAHNSVEG